jgi:hypothetical protein
MTSIQKNIPYENGQPPHATIGELNGAQDDLRRLLAILTDAFGELMESFSAVQTFARQAGSVPEIDRQASRAIKALQCEDLAGQLIAFTQKRLTLASELLKNCPLVPQTSMTSAVLSPVGATGIHVGAELGSDLAKCAPVQQHAMHAGSIELF